MLSGFLPVSYVVDTPEEADIIVDDLIDSESTKFRYEKKYEKPFYALIDKKKENIDEFIIFPWEESDIDTPVEDNVIRLQQYFKSSKNNKALHLIQDLMEEISAT